MAEGLMRRLLGSAAVFRADFIRRDPFCTRPGHDPQSGEADRHVFAAMARNDAGLRWSAARHPQESA